MRATPIPIDTRLRPPTMVPDGILVIDKPAGMTSHDVVARIRRVLGIRKVGHAGTLDPMATGVLVIGVGRGTRLLGFLAGSDKEYRATIRLGASSSTDDGQGDIGPWIPIAGLEDSDIRSALMGFTGEIEQVPSAVSAIHVDGKRAHERVRAGETVALAPRRVRIELVTVHDITRTEHWIDIDCTVVCSAGTYVRAIARDLGVVLGVGGHLVALRRIRSGAFVTMQGLPDDASECAILPLGAVARSSFPVIELTTVQAERVSHGIRIPVHGGAPSGVHALMDPRGELIAMGEVDHEAWRYRAVFVGQT
jgi:tRNA pseudouridine55 synthase